jgi:hypothetical protein
MKNLMIRLLGAALLALAAFLFVVALGAAAGERAAPVAPAAGHIAGRVPILVPPCCPPGAVPLAPAGRGAL